MGDTMRYVAVAFCAILTIGAVVLVSLQDRLVPGVAGEAYFRQPAFFPVLTLVMVTGLGIASTLRYALGGRLHEDEELAGTTPHLATILAIAVLFAAYVLLVTAVGYLLATLAFALGALIVTRAADLRSTISIILVALALFAVFRLYLDVWFPEPMALDLMRRP